MNKVVEVHTTTAPRTWQLNTTAVNRKRHVSTPARIRPGAVRGTLHAFPHDGAGGQHADAPGDAAHGGREAAFGGLRRA